MVFLLPFVALPSPCLEGFPPKGCICWLHPSFSSFFFPPFASFRRKLVQSNKCSCIFFLPCNSICFGQYAHSSSCMFHMITAEQMHTPNTCLIPDGVLLLVIFCIPWSVPSLIHLTGGFQPNVDRILRPGLSSSAAEDSAIQERFENPLPQNSTRGGAFIMLTNCGIHLFCDAVLKPCDAHSETATHLKLWGENALLCLCPIVATLSCILKSHYLAFS